MIDFSVTHNLNAIRNILRNESPYFPDYIIRQYDEKTIYVSTILRFRHTDNNWYAWHHMNSRIISTSINDTIHNVTKELLRNVYLSIKYGKIDLNLRDSFNEPLWYIDKLQISEEERFKLKSNESN